MRIDPIPGGSRVRQRFTHGPGASFLRAAAAQVPDRAAEIIAARLDGLRANMSGAGSVAGSGADALASSGARAMVTAANTAASPMPMSESQISHLVVPDGNGQTEP